MLLPLDYFFPAIALWIATRCDCDRVGTRYFPLLRLIRLVFEWMLIITVGFLFSNADILFSLVGRVFHHGDDWTPPQALLPLEVEWLISLL
jgi:hypothetical protein